MKARGGVLYSDLDLSPTSLFFIYSSLFMFKFGLKSELSQIAHHPWPNI